MKAERLSPKDFEELLKIMRMWPDPYRSNVAKLIHHISWQMDEIKRLDDRLRSLEQVGLEEEIKKVKATFPGAQEVKQEDPPKQYYKKTPPEKWPLSKRLRFYKSTGDKKAWDSTLKWNNLTEEKALVMVQLDITSDK